MGDFFKRHKLVTKIVKSVVFLALLGLLGAYGLTSYLGSHSTGIATLDRNNTAGVSQAIEANIPVFIEACRPMCAEQLPEVEAAAAQLEGQVVFFQIDPEAEPELMATLAQILGRPITAFPAHIVLAETPAVSTGAKTAAQLVAFITQATGLQSTTANNSAGADQSGGQPEQSATQVPAYTYQHVTVVTQDTIEQELNGVTIPVYILLCDGHECELQAEALDAVAGRYAGQVKFIQINWYDNPQITLALVRGAQMPLAFPIHVILSPDGSILNYASFVLQEAQIEAFISDAMANAQATTAAGASNATVTPAASQPNAAIPSPTRTPVPTATVHGAH